MPLITDADLARARVDEQFRHTLLTHSLEALLAALKRAQRDELSQTTADQMKEGAALAVSLADRLQRLGIPVTPQAA
jgi:hypothetical protein